jgi:DNA-binding CsgD family transcriptional regulator
MPQRKQISFERLLLDLYGALEPSGSWTPFLSGLSEAMNAAACTLILRLPGPGDRGELYSVNTDLAFENTYREMQSRDDPFNDMPSGVPCALADVISPEALRASAFYRDLLAPDGTTDILALNILTTSTRPVILRLSRRDASTPFGVLEKSLLSRLLPYLSSAFAIHAQRRQLLLEREAHIGALDQLAFGLVILDERGAIVRINEHAQQLLDRSRLLRVEGGRLRGPSAAASGGRRLEDAIQAMHTAAEGERQFLRVTDAEAGEFVQILLRPITPPGPRDSRAPCGVAIFLNDELRNRDVYLGRFGQLYSLSRAEIALIDELLQGSSIATAADKLGISENTARTQLRSVFSKTNVHRQAELIRLVLTSLAIIA